MEELRLAVANLPNNKTPGPDGLPGETYQKYGDVLLLDLLEVFNHAMEVGFLPPSMNEAVISLLPKPGKDPTSPDAYRPISLLTSDIKLLTKLLATRLSKYITKIIHHDQSGFIPNGSAASNVKRLFLNLQLPIDNSGNRAILSLDAATAFDSIEWDFLWNCLKCFVFGPRCIKWIQLLYSNPSATVQINGYILAPFFIE